MKMIVSTSRIRDKYGSWSQKILRAAENIAPVLDVSGMSAEQIRAQIAGLPKDEVVSLMGGYDMIPPFSRPNPTWHIGGDDDRDILTDAPYGATPSKAAEELAPVRAVSRIPDSPTGDAPGFLKLLSFQQRLAPTPPGSFQEAADEFSGPAQFVQQSIPGSDRTIFLSPPAKMDDPIGPQNPDIPKSISRVGRVHILLHGANRSPDWAFLYGHSQATPRDWPEAVSARLLDLCDLRGAVVTFSSCYAAMLDTGESEAEVRSEANQVALACLGHGAKCVLAGTRSNWIQTNAPYNGFGPGLMAAAWGQLAEGLGAAEALRRAKRVYLTKALSSGGKRDQPYIFKTALHFQCYGRADAVL